MGHTRRVQRGGLSLTHAAFATLLAAAIGLAGCWVSPVPDGALVEPVDGLWRDFFPTRYGFSNPGGSGDSMPDGSFILAPDWSMRLECQRRPSGFGQRFLLSNLSGGSAPVELFSSDDFEPGVQLTSYWYRVVWAGTSQGLYVTAFCPESPPELATVQYRALAGEIAPVAPGVVRGWAIIAALAGTDFLVVMEDPPTDSKLAILDPEVGVVSVPPQGVAWEDSTGEGYFLYAAGNQETPNPIYLGATGSWEAAPVATAWCARFRPGHSTYSYVAPNDCGTTTVWERATDGAPPEAIVELPFAQASDFFWLHSDTFYVLGTLPQAGEGSVVKVSLPESLR